MRFNKSHQARWAIQFFVSVILANIPTLVSPSEIVMDCYTFAYKLEKSMFGLRKTVHRKLISHEVSWHQFCQWGEITFEGNVVSCKKVHKSFYRINPDKIATATQKFECPITAIAPNQPEFLRFRQESSSTHEPPLLARFGNTQEHFEQQKCEYVGEMVNVPIVERKTNDGEWAEMDFPSAYPFIRFEDSNGETDWTANHIYERLVFSDIDASYTSASGSLYFTYLDFALGTVGRKSLRINPYTGEPIINTSHQSVLRCEKITQQ